MGMTRRNRTVQLFTLLFTVLTFAPGAAVTGPAVAESCVRSQGYWKTHASEWPAARLVLGDAAFAAHTYQHNELLSFLSAPAGGDASLILATQLIAAKLNVANGASAAPIADWLTRADSLLASFRQRLPNKVKTNTPVGADMTTVANPAWIQITTTMMKNELMPGIQELCKPNRRRSWRKNCGSCSPGHNWMTEFSRP